MVEGTPSSADSKRIVRIRCETWLVVSVLEGVGGAAFIAFMMRDSKPGFGPAYQHAVGSAFLIGVAVALLLWPRVWKAGRFQYARAAGFGALVVLITSWLWTIALALLPPNPAFVFRGFWMNAWGFVQLLGFALIPAGIGAIWYGWLTFSIGIGIAWAVAAWGNWRLGDGSQAGGIAGSNG